MEIRYTILYQSEVVAKHIPRLSASAKVLIKRAIEERLKVDPVGFGKPLSYSFKGARRLRASDYRVTFRIDQENYTVVVIAIQHRKDVYAA